MIRDGQSLAEASATLFKDILLGNPTKCTHCSSCEYPTSLPPSLRLQDIQFHHLLPNGRGQQNRFCCPPKAPLRRNNSLISLWGDSDIPHRRGVISGVPGLRSSIHPLVLVNKHSNKKGPKVTFKLPEGPSNNSPMCCCFYCYCCPCCAFDLLQFDPPSLPPKNGGAQKKLQKKGVENHYVSPSPRDGDYSYAYDSSVSPAFLIKWQNARENLYEEIVDVREEMKKLTHNPESNSDSGIGNLVLSGSLGTLDVKKSMVQRANSFSSRDNNYNISNPGSRSNSLKATSKTMISPCCPKGKGHRRSHEGQSPPSSQPNSDQKIRGLFKRVLHKWSHC